MTLPERLREARADWGLWLPVALIPLWFLLVMIVTGNARIEHYPIAVILTGLALYSAASRDLLRVTAPGIAVVFAHEGFGYLRPRFVVEDRIWGCELHQIDAALFGFGSGQTPADFFSTRTTPFADLVFAVPYTLFWLGAVLFVLVLYVTDRPTMRRFLWLLVMVHIVAFVFWLVMPAAPPWYIRAHGCRIDADALPSAAGLARLDVRFGISYFAEFYSRAATVFGALPSLHVAFPTAALFAAWSSLRLAGRLTMVGLTGWMLLASVYLDHHWLIDGILAILIVAALHALLLRIAPRYAEQAPPRPQRKNGV